MATPLRCAVAALAVLTALCAVPLGGREAHAENPILVTVSADRPVHVLRHLTHLLRPSTAPSNRVCIATTADAATVLETAATQASALYWIRVRFSSGRCAGLEGWIASDSIRLE